MGNSKTSETRGYLGIIHLRNTLLGLERRLGFGN